MKTIEISEETYEKIKDQLTENDFEIDSLEDMVGKKFFFRNITYHCTGRVVKIMGHFWVLEDAAWIADSGRFMQAIKEGKLDEVEPVGTMYVNIKSNVDFFPWKHQLPKEQK